MAILDEYRFGSSEEHGNSIDGYLERLIIWGDWLRLYVAHELGTFWSYGVALA